MSYFRDIALPELDVAAGRRRSEQHAPLDEDQPAAPSRNRRAAKHVASGLDATTELHYDAAQAESKAATAAPAETSAEAAADAAAGETVQLTESEQPLLDVVLLVSTKPHVSQQYEDVAQSLGARVSETHEPAARDSIALGESDAHCSLVTSVSGCQVVKRLNAAVTHVRWDGQLAATHCCLLACHYCNTPHQYDCLPLYRVQTETRRC